MLALLDRLLAVTAMLVCVRPLVAGLFGSSSHLSWPRVLALLAGGLASCTWTVGLLALRSELFERPLVVPNLLGVALAHFGGMLGVATLLARRGQQGMSETAALRAATQAAAMALYVAAPVAALVGLGLTRLVRATLPWTLVRLRWAGVLEGLLLLAVAALQALGPTLPLEQRGLWLRAPLGFS